MSKDKGKIAIIGSGLIGKGWAMLFTGGEYRVNLYDVDPVQIERALKDIKEQLTRYEETGVLRGELRAEQQYALITGCTDLNTCVQRAIHVQECTPEDLELKKSVFKQLDALVTDHMVLSSSSSALPVSSFTSHLKHKHRCIISHPVNPPYLMPLVELVPAPYTEQEVVVKTRALMADIGQSPVIVKKEILGFVQPRIQYALIQECLKLVLDGVISAEDVDKIMTYGLGPRYSFVGPFMTAHLNAHGMASYIDHYGEMIYNIMSKSAPPVRMKDNPQLEVVFEELNKITPLEALEEKRLWRDNGIAALARLRREMDKKDSGKTFNRLE